MVLSTRSIQSTWFLRTGWWPQHAVSRIVCQPPSASDRNAAPPAVRDPRPRRFDRDLPKGTARGCLCLGGLISWSLSYTVQHSGVSHIIAAATYHRVLITGSDMASGVVKAFMSVFRRRHPQKSTQRRISDGWDTKLITPTSRSSDR